MNAPRILLPLVGLCMAWPAGAQEVAFDGYRGLQIKMSQLGVYGRLGPDSTPAAQSASLSGPGSGLTYAVGLSWDFSPRGSAVLGWESWDWRLGGERSTVRSTSLGLQWRY
jgi:hypothetical protein